jgi:hypothetical protein
VAAVKRGAVYTPEGNERRRFLISGVPRIIGDFSDRQVFGIEGR